MTKQTKENLNDITVFGLIGIVKVFGSFKDIKKNKVTLFTLLVSLFLKIVKKIKVIVYTLLISLFLQIVIISESVDTYQSIIMTKDIMMSFLPNILGFTIAGYTLIVGFIQNNMLNKITEPLGDDKYSLYQKMSSTFAINIIFQALSLIISYAYNFVIFIDKNKKNAIYYNSNFINIVNYYGLFFILIFFILSTFLIIQIVINIFNFSQLHHYIIVKEKIDNNDDN